MITRRGLLGMLSAGIASVAVSTRLAAAELKVVGEDEPESFVGYFTLRDGLHYRFSPPNKAELLSVSGGVITQVVFSSTVIEGTWADLDRHLWRQAEWDDATNEHVMRQFAGS